MSVEIKYKGNTIASASTDTTKTIKTSGKYCEADIEVVNIQDGGITPTGNINITDTNVTDVTNYATAQVVDADLVAENIKKDVNILGIIGTYEGGGGGHNLPTEYQEVEFIASYPNGSQYVDCGFVGENKKIIIEAKLERDAANQSIFGACDTQAKGFFLTWFNNKWYFGRGSATQGNVSGVSALTRQTIIYNDDSGNIVQNGSILGSVVSGSTSTETLKIFARKTGGSVDTFAIMKLYKFQIYDKTTGVKEQDLIPCYIKSDGTVGLFDVVSNSFLANSGGGFFIAGSDIT